MFSLEYVDDTALPLKIITREHYLQVVPGGSEEFNMFITKDLRTARPDVFLGVLQSAFILGAIPPPPLSSARVDAFGTLEGRR